MISLNQIYYNPLYSDPLVTYCTEERHTLSPDLGKILFKSIWNTYSKYFSIPFLVDLDFYSKNITFSIICLFINEHYYNLDNTHLSGYLLDINYIQINIGR